MRAKKIQQRLARIEKKCDAILALLENRGTDEIGRIIDTMHKQARRMREQANMETRAIRNFFKSRRHDED